MFKVSLFVYTSGEVRGGPFNLGAVFRVQNSPRPRGLTCGQGVAFMVYETKHNIVTVERLVTVAM